MTYFLDTNLLVYSVETQDPFKRDRARKVLNRLLEPGRAAVSSQVLAEFSRVALKKLGWTADRCYQQVERYELLYSVFPLTAAVVLEALRGVREYRFSYYDGQIWAAAKLYQVHTVLSEDFQAGSTIEGVRFENPFDPSFDLSWLA